MAKADLAAGYVIIAKSMRLLFVKQISGTVNMSWINLLMRRPITTVIAFFGGQALRHHLNQKNLSAALCSTDTAIMGVVVCSKACTMHTVSYIMASTSSAEVWCSTVAGLIAGLIIIAGK